MAPYAGGLPATGRRTSRSAPGRWRPRPATARCPRPAPRRPAPATRRGRSRSRSSAAGTTPIGVSLAAGGSLEPADDPREHAGVLAVAGPEELPVLVLAEPVDAVDPRGASPRRCGRSSTASARSSRPCGSRRTAASRTGRGAGRRCRRTRPPSSPSPSWRRRRRRAPVARLVHERDGRGAAAAEEHGRDRDALRVLPLVGDHRALRRRCAEPGVRVRGGRLGRRGPVLALPVGERARAARRPCPPTRRRRRR